MTKYKTLAKIKARRYYGHIETWDLIEDDGELYVGHGGDIYHSDSFLKLVDDLNVLAKKLKKVQSEKN